MSWAQLLPPTSAWSSPARATTAWIASTALAGALQEVTMVLGRLRHVRTAFEFRVSSTAPKTLVSTEDQNLGWGLTGNVFAPSHESRLNPVYPLSVNSIGGDLDFVWQFKSDGFFVVATGNAIQIKSRITDGP